MIMVFLVIKHIHVKNYWPFFFFFFVGSFPERLFWLFCFSPVWYPLFSVKGTLTKK